jgi:hypothetical protein
MARPHFRNELWPHLLRMEKYCRDVGHTPRDAARRVVRESGGQLPGYGNDMSKVQLLEKYHRDCLDELRKELEGIPHTFERVIVMTSPTKLTFAKEWRTRLARLIDGFKNTQKRSG